MKGLVRQTESDNRKMKLEWRKQRGTK